MAHQIIVALVICLQVSLGYNPGTSWRMYPYFSFVRSNGGGLTYESETFIATKDVRTFYTNDNSLFALKDDGALDNVLEEDLGNVYPPTGSDKYKMLYTTEQAWIGLTTTGTVKTWGASAFGADSSGVASELVNITTIVTNNNVIVARKSDGTVVAWLGDAWQSVASSTISGVVSMFSAGTGVATLKADGTAHLLAPNSSVRKLLSAVAKV